MTSHKSPSSQRYADLYLNEPSDEPSTHEVLAKRRMVADSAKEGTQYNFITAFPKHPKAGRILSNTNSNRTLTGKKMAGNRFDVRKVTRQIERPLGKMNWELVISR